MRFPYSGNGTWTPDYHCGFIDAVKRFFIGYMEFRGRSSRREFWLAMLFFIPVSVLIFLIPAAGTVSGILWMLATMVPKSVTFTLPSMEIIMFCGFTSRCTIP